MQTYVSPSSEVGQGPVPSPSCPTCKLEMRFVQATSIAFTPDLVDVSYICDECGRGTKRTLKDNLKSSSWFFTPSTSSLGWNREYFAKTVDDIADESGPSLLRCPLIHIKVQIAPG